MRILLALLALSGCSTEFIPEGDTGDCPYDIPTEEMIQAIDGVSVLPSRELAQICGEGYRGCVSRSFHVYVDLSLPVTDRHDVTRHEACHAYEVAELGYSWEHTASHTGWRRQR